MGRRRVAGAEYLYLIAGKVERSLGVRSPATERIKSDHDHHRDRLKRRLATLDARIKEMARINRAAGLGRGPTTAARILRRLDAARLFGRRLFVVGNPSPFAFQAAVGIFFRSCLTGT